MRNRKVNRFTQVFWPWCGGAQLGLTSQFIFLNCVQWSSLRGFGDPGSSSPEVLMGPSPHRLQQWRDYWHNSPFIILTSHKHRDRNMAFERPSETMGAHHLLSQKSDSGSRSQGEWACGDLESGAPAIQVGLSDPLLAHGSILLLSCT